MIRGLFTGFGRGFAGGWAGVLCPVFPVITGMLAFFRELRELCGGPGRFKLDLFTRPASQMRFGLTVGLFVVSFLAARHLSCSVALLDELHSMNCGCRLSMFGDLGLGEFGLREFGFVRSFFVCG